MKPPVGTQIDWNHPLSDGLIFFAPLNEYSGDGIDMVTGTRGVAQTTGTSTLTRSIDRYGQHLDLEIGATTDYNGLAWSAHPAWNLTGKTMTVITHCKREDEISGNGAGVISKLNNSFSAGVELRLASSTTSRLRINGNNVEATIPNSAGVDSFIAGSADGTTAKMLYRNKASGSPTHTASLGYSGSIGDTSTTPMTLGQHINGARMLDGAIYWGGYWNRTLTEDQIISMWDNPWQIFKPKRIVGISRAPETVNYVPIPKPWTKQPPVGTPIDFTHSMAKGLVAAIPILGANDRTTDNGYKDYGPNHFAVNDDGVISFGQDEHGGYVECPTAGGIFIESCRIPQAEATIFIGVRPAVGYTTARLLGSNDAFECNIGSTGTSNQLFHGGAVPPAGGQGFAGGAYAELAYIAINGGASQLVLTGSDEFYYEDTLSPSTNNGTTPTATQDMYVGSSRNLADGLEGKVYYFFMFDRAFGVAEAINFMHNPWQIFKPQTVLAPLPEELPAVAKIEKKWDRQP